MAEPSPSPTPSTEPKLPSDLPIVDHHAHLSPNGEGIAAARRFAHAGGTHLFLATQNYDPTTPDSIAAYARQFATTVRLGDRLRTEVGIEVYCVIAPYPVDLVHQAEQMGVRPAVDLQVAALELAGDLIAERKAVGLGEVGRPHFPVSPEIHAAASEVFGHALSVARERDCPVIVHCEDLDAVGYARLAEEARAASLPAHRVVKHYARSVTPPAALAGVVPSYLARRATVAAACAQRGPWFLETDFLDDPARPGAVLDLATVPRRARAALGQGSDAIERLRVPFVESVRRVYGITPVTDRGEPAA